MKTVFTGKRISGLLAVVPKTEVLFDDEIKNYSFPEKQTQKLKRLMGYEKHRIVMEDTSSSDLVLSGLRHLIDEKLIDLSTIGAIVTASITPDYQLPGISNIVHGELDFPKDVLCIDITQGCASFMQGLLQAYMLLEHLGDKKVLLINADVLSKKVSKRDRNSYPLIGDAASITIVENDPNAENTYFSMYHDGKRRESLIIPAGGSRLAHSPETAIMKDEDGDGNYRSLDNLKMDGTGVFEFVQTDVPPMIDEILADSGKAREDIDWYLFHQPNRFMLKKLAEAVGIPYEKVPMNIVENFGNASGVCIPVNIAFNLGKSVVDNEYSCCLSAFGSGLTWSALVTKLGGMNFCELYEADK